MGLHHAGLPILASYEYLLFKSRSDRNECPPYNETASRATTKVCATHVASRNGRKPGARYVVPAAQRRIKWQAAETLSTQFLQAQLHSNYLRAATGRCVPKRNAKRDGQLSPRPAIPKFCAATPRDISKYCCLFQFMCIILSKGY